MRLGGSGARSDEGLSLVELVVAMMIFSVVIAVYFGALISMSHDTVRAQDTVDAADGLRSAFNHMDHQARYATAINRPGVGNSGNWYVEFESAQVPAGASPECYQWRFDPSDGSLAFRTWTEDGSSTVTDWRAVAWDVQATSGGSPFVFTPASGTVLRQSLTIDLTVEGVTTGVVASQATTFVARNSSYSSLSNLDADGDGSSDNPVCSAGMDRP